MKKLFIFIVILYSLASVTFAIDNNDCLFSLTNKTLDWWDENNTDPIKANLAKAMPKEAIEKAVSNLSSYCCDINERDESWCTKTNDSIYPESVYLFDHILDVYLRRLDAKQKGDNWADLLYSLTPDDMWLEWRTFITNIWNNAKGSLPLQITEKFSAMWKLTNKVDSFQDSDDSTIKTRKNSLTWAIVNYDNWTLWDKYNLACDLAKYISEDYLYITSKKLTTQEYNLCKSLVEKRITNEKTYTQLILMQKANVLLAWNMKSYLNTYFVANKLSELQDNVFNVSSLFWEVNTAVWELTPECQS